MSSLVRWLYPVPVRGRSPAAIVGWWERRRAGFILVVGLTGLFTLAATSIIGTIPPLSGGWPVPFVAVVAYGVMANLFYTGGWIVEWLFNAWWGDDAPAIGPLLWRQGLIFSVGLTLLPIGMAALRWVAVALIGLLR